MKNPLGTRLNELAALLHTTPLGAALPRFTGGLASALAADFVQVLEYLPDEEHLLMVAGAGFADPLVGRERVPGSLHSQAGYTMLKREPVVVADYSRENRFGRPGPVGESGLASGVTVPIPPEGTIYGVLGIYTTKPRIFEDAEISFLTRAASYLAAAVQRDKESRARKTAQRWLTALEETAIRSASALDEAGALQAYVKLLTNHREGISDHAFVDLEHTNGSGEVIRSAAARQGALLDPWTSAWSILKAPEPGAPHGTPKVLDTGQPELIPLVTDDLLQNVSRDSRHLETLRSLAPASYLCVPIKVRRRTLGALVLVRSNGAPSYTLEDQRHACRLADVVGLGIEGVRAHRSRLSSARQRVEPYRRPEPPTAPIEPPLVASPQTPSSIEDTTMPLLSCQRRAVLNLLVAGATTKQIAAKLGVETSTVYSTEYRLKEIFGVSGKNRVVLVREALRRGFDPEV